MRRWPTCTRTIRCVCVADVEPRQRPGRMRSVRQRTAYDKTRALILKVASRLFSNRKTGGAATASTSRSCARRGRAGVLGALPAVRGDGPRASATRLPRPRVLPTLLADLEAVETTCRRAGPAKIRIAHNAPSSTACLAAGAPRSCTASRAASTWVRTRSTPTSRPSPAAASRTSRSRTVLSRRRRERARDPVPVRSASTAGCSRSSRGARSPAAARRGAGDVPPPRASSTSRTCAGTRSTRRSTLLDELDPDADRAGHLLTRAATASRASRTCTRTRRSGGSPSATG